MIYFKSVPEQQAAAASEPEVLYEAASLRWGSLKKAQLAQVIWNSELFLYNTDKTEQRVALRVSKLWILFS